MNNQPKPKALLHHRLTNSEWTKTVRDLTFAQIKVLYHIKTLDPFGDRELEISISQMARDLGLNKSTVSRALKELDKLGLLDVTLLKVKVQVSTHLKGLPLYSQSEESEPLPPRNVLPPRNERCVQETLDASTQPEIPAGNDSRPELIENNASNSSHTSLNSSDFKEKKERPKLFKKEQDKMQLTIDPKNLPPEQGSFEHQLVARQITWALYPQRHKEIEIWAKQHPNVQITGDGPKEWQPCN